MILETMTCAGSRHPLLDLSPMEQVIVRLAHSNKMRPGDTLMGEHDAIAHLLHLGLIELHDGAWSLTQVRGSLVAYIFNRIDLARSARRSPSALEKKEAIDAGVARTLEKLIAEVHALPDRVPGP